MLIRAARDGAQLRSELGHYGVDDDAEPPAEDDHLQFGNQGRDGRGNQRGGGRNERNNRGRGGDRGRGAQGGDDRRRQ